MSESTRIRKTKVEARSVHPASSAANQPTSPPDQLRQRLLALILKNEAARKAPQR